MKALAETLRDDARDRDAARVHDGWDDPANPDYQEPAAEPSGGDDALGPVPCGKRLYQAPIAGGGRGWQWVRCKALVDEFGDCPRCDR